MGNSLPALTISFVRQLKNGIENGPSIFRLKPISLGRVRGGWPCFFLGERANRQAPTVIRMLAFEGTLLS